MRANIRQVAEMAGVSRTTVSNVLLGKTGRITAEKRDTVLRAVEELGYVPVKPVLQNRAEKTRVLALALHEPSLIHFKFHSQVYAGVCEAALRHDYDVLTVLRSNPKWAVNRKAVSLLDRRSDGILFLPPSDNNTELFQDLADSGIPTVATYQREVPDGIAWVDPDNVMAINLMVDHLVDHGHSRIVHVTAYVNAQYDFRVRKQAFIEAMQRHSLAIPEEFIIDATYGLDSEMASRIIATGATAALCANDSLAMRLWEEVENIGLRVPNNISITGIDHQSDEFGSKQLTTVEFSYSGLGVVAVDALIDLIAGKDAKDCCREIPPRFVSGNSVKRLCTAS